MQIFYWLVIIAAVVAVVQDVWFPFTGEHHETSKRSPEREDH